MLGIQLALNKLLVVFLDVTCLCHFQQVVAGVHLLTQRIQRAYHLCDIGDDGVGILVGHFGQEMFLNAGVDAELNLLRVNEHDFKFCGMLLI